MPNTLHTKIMSTKRIRASVTGKVQKVGFRWYVWKNAVRIGLTGWVKNMPDGSVLLEAQGNAEAMADFLSLVKRGPKTGSVDQMEIKEIKLSPKETEFVIDES